MPEPRGCEFSARYHVSDPPHRAGHMGGIARDDDHGQATGQDIEPFTLPIPSFLTEPYPDTNVRGGPHLQAPQH